MISLIFLASGFGRRFGSNKLLTQFRGKALYLHGLDTLVNVVREREDLRLIVVTQYEEIEAKARELGLEVIHNDQASQGITASIRLGVGAASGSEWFGFFMADQPFLQKETIDTFLSEMITSGHSMGSTCAGGQPGNPCFFHARWESALEKLQGDRGGRVIMKEHPKEVFWYEIDSKELQDMDLAETLLQYELSN